jgi:hypothetical protein
VEVHGTVADYGGEWENRLQDQLDSWLQEQLAGGPYYSCRHTTLSSTLVLLWASVPTVGLSPCRHVQ